MKYVKKSHPAFRYAILLSLLTLASTPPSAVAQDKKAATDGVEKGKYQAVEVAAFNV